MTSLTTNRRHLKQLQAAQALEQRVKKAVSDADHYTETDRAVAESLEAAELFRAFLAEEL